MIDFDIKRFRRILALITRKIIPSILLLDFFNWRLGSRGSFLGFALFFFGLRIRFRSRFGGFSLRLGLFFRNILFGGRLLRINRFWLFLGGWFGFLLLFRLARFDGSLRLGSLLFLLFLALGRFGLRLRILFGLVCGRRLPTLLRGLWVFGLGRLSALFVWRFSFCVFRSLNLDRFWSTSCLRLSRTL